MVRDKVRIRFRKDGNLRWISHHDLMRCFERMLRRADIPFHVTAGFNPKPRLIFALSLPLGVIGCEELAELELTREIPAQQIHDRLVAQAPPGLAILSVERIPSKACAHVRKVRYRVPISPSQGQVLQERLAPLLNSSHCWIERRRPRPRRIDLRPYLSDLRLVAGALEIDLWVTPQGTARPDEILAVLDVGSADETEATVERIVLELEEETEALIEARGGKETL